MAAPRPRGGARRPPVFGLSQAAEPVRALRGDLLLSGVVVVGLWATVPPQPGRLVQASLALVAVVAVLARRRAPVVCFAGALAATAAAWVAGASADPCVLAGACLLTLVEQRRTASVSWPVLLVAAGAGAALLLTASDQMATSLRWLVTSGLVLAVAWALGVRNRQLAHQAARHAATEERLRISREVHDTLSHTLGSIGVRAGIAAHLTSQPPDVLRESLREVSDEARSALSQLHDVVHGLRADPDTSDAPDAPDTAGPTGPSHVDLSPTLAELAGTLSECGITTTVQVDDAARWLPRAVAHELGRIAQEATTNVIRHSGATRCSLTLASGPGQRPGGRDATQPSRPTVLLEVRDDGRGPGGAEDRGAREGHGLRGLRERVALLGGELTSAPAPGDAGFRVLVRIPAPLPSEESPADPAAPAGAPPLLPTGSRRTTRPATAARGTAQPGTSARGGTGALP